MDEAEIVLDVVFPASDEAAEVVEPGEEPLHVPASFIAAQWPPVLGFAPVAAVGRDHFNRVFVLELLVEPVRVVGLVADQPRGQLAEEASGEDLFDKRAFRR